MRGCVFGSSADADDADYQGDGGESPGGANTHEGKVRPPKRVYTVSGLVVPLPGLLAHPLTRMRRAGSSAHAVGPGGRSLAIGRPVSVVNGQTSEVTAESPSGGAEKGQERRGPERGAAGREEQDPEGRTPWMLGGRRAVIRRARPCERSSPRTRRDSRGCREQTAGRVIKPWERTVPGHETPGRTGSAALACVEGDQTP
jgi:hypothetical protein